MSTQTISIVFRALNEEKWFGEALEACGRQRLDNGAAFEIVLVDSGSTDATLAIAERHGCRIVHIRKADFTFGRSLNYGCAAARGDILVFISAHCIPAHDRWLANLVRPLIEGEADYVYGKQLGHEVSHFSEHQVFAHFFGEDDQLPQTGFFCNNANAAIRRDIWERHRFDEEVTGLEDMVLARALVREGGRIGYVADAPVIHIHEETFSQTRRRYYREALTLREIMPEVHFTLADFIRCYFAGVFHDLSAAAEQKRLVREIAGIVSFRFAQYWGAYLGHNEHRELSRAQKESYYYPRPKRRRRGRESDAPSAGETLLARSLGENER